MNYKRTTQTPNTLFDHHLKTLTETKLKVLMTIIRKTMGQQDPGCPDKRIERAWISQRLFCICTGKSGRAVSSAIDELSNQGLIEITDIKGTVLATKSKRRGASRLYFASRLDVQEPAPATYDLICDNAVKKGHTIKLNEIKQSCYNSSVGIRKLSDLERYRQIQNLVNTTSQKAPTTSTIYSRSIKREQKNM